MKSLTGLGIRSPTVDEVEKITFRWVLPALFLALLLAATWIVIRNAFNKQANPRAEPLPPNAKFEYRGRIFWATPRRYTKQEAGSVREALREIYDCLNGQAAPIVANYDGPATSFTREWTTIIQKDGPQSAIATLVVIRNQIRAVHSELQAILGRRPYFGRDMRSLINDNGETGEMNGALNNYIDALQHLPDTPAVDLIKLAIGPSQSALVKAIEKYNQWIAAFNTKVLHLKDELEFLME